MAGRYPEPWTRELDAGRGDGVAWAKRATCWTVGRRRTDRADSRWPVDGPGGQSMAGGRTRRTADGRDRPGEPDRAVAVRAMSPGGRVVQIGLPTRALRGADTTNNILLTEFDFSPYSGYHGLLRSVSKPWFERSVGDVDRNRDPTDRSVRAPDAATRTFSGALKTDSNPVPVDSP